MEDPKLTNDIKEHGEAMFADAFPCNPRPFLRILNLGLEARGTGWIESDEAKRILFVVIALAYGQLATIDLVEEWRRLKETKG